MYITIGRILKETFRSLMKEQDQAIIKNMLQFISLV